MPLGLLGKKLGHTRVYNAQGVLMAVTVVQAGPNRVLQVKTVENDGYKAVQLGFGEQKPQRLNRPLLGQFAQLGIAEAAAEKQVRDAARKPKKSRKSDDTASARAPEQVQPIAAVARIREFRDFSKEVKPGEMVGANLFAPGDFIDAIGVTKGRGFEGVMKRHNFRGGDMTHGAKGWHRRNGAIGNRLFPGTVLRGMKMPGHMGQVRCTTQNLEVIQVREADNILLIKGSIPGAEGDYVIIRESKKIPKGTVRKVPAPTGKAAKAAAAKAEAKPAAK